MILRFVCITDITLASFFSFHLDLLYSSRLFVRIASFQCVLRIYTPVTCSAVRNPGVRVCTSMGESVVASAAAAFDAAAALNVDITFVVLNLILVHVIAAISVKKHFVRIRL